MDNHERIMMGGVLAQDINRLFQAAGAKNGLPMGVALAALAVAAASGVSSVPLTDQKSLTDEFLTTFHETLVQMRATQVPGQTAAQRLRLIKNDNDLPPAAA